VGIVHYTIDDELHQRAKVAAAQLGITLKELLERALEEKVRAVERRAGRKR
jgi:predicted HicB family RNase H-like nuclease